MMNEGQNQPSIEKQQKETLSSDSPFEFLTIFSVEYKLYFKGIYFALHSRYSHAYAYRSSDLDGKKPCKSGLYFHLIVAQVVRGAIKYESDAWQSNDKSLLADAGQRELGDQYDSVEGGPHRPHRRGPGENDSPVSVVYRYTSI